MTGAWSGLGHSPSLACSFHRIPNEKVILIAGESHVLTMLSTRNRGRELELLWPEPLGSLFFCKISQRVPKVQIWAIYATTSSCHTLFQQTCSVVTGTLGKVL